LKPDVKYQFILKLVIKVLKSDVADMVLASKFLNLAPPIPSPSLQARRSVVVYIFRYKV
jgi:hypothetical protein